MRHRQSFVITVFLLVGALLFPSETQAELKIPEPTDRLEKVVFNMIETYNNMDSVGSRKYYSPKLLVNISLEEAGQSLSFTRDRYGKVESFEIIRGLDGSRALAILTLEKIIFDAHIRLDENGKLVREEWYPHFIDPSTRNVFSSADPAKQEARFRPIVDKFVKAFRGRNASEIIALMTSDKPDDPGSVSEEDVNEIISNFLGRGEIANVAEIEFEDKSTGTLPITFGEMTYGFKLTLNEDDEISQMAISNYAKVESLGKSLADIGPDTTLTSDLLDFTDLQERFDQDSGKVRFIALLAPT